MVFKVDGLVSVSLMVSFLPSTRTVGSSSLVILDVSMEEDPGDIQTKSCFVLVVPRETVLESPESTLFRWKLSPEN
jgi:hypothetical protein